MKRHAISAEPDAQATAPTDPAPLAPHVGAIRPSSSSRPRSREEAEAHYVESRDAWTAAMHAASSGRPADLATLALAQEAYEAAVADRERWLTGHVALPIEPAVARRNLEIALGQERAWREIHEQPRGRGLLGRLRRRLGSK